MYTTPFLTELVYLETTISMPGLVEGLVKVVLARPGFLGGEVFLGLFLLLSSENATDLVSLPDSSSSSSSSPDDRVSSVPVVAKPYRL